MEEKCPGSRIQYNTTTRPFAGFNNLDILEFCADLEEIPLLIPQKPKYLRDFLSINSTSLNTFRGALLSMDPSDAESSIVDVKFRALEHLFSHQHYWRHPWVVQELCLAHDAQFLCGSRHFRLSALRVIIFAFVRFHRGVISTILSHRRGLEVGRTISTSTFML